MICRNACANHRGARASALFPARSPAPEAAIWQDAHALCCGPLPAPGCDSSCLSNSAVFVLHILVAHACHSVLARPHAWHTRVLREPASFMSQDPAHSHSAGTTDTEWSRKEFSRTATRRVFDGELVSELVRCAAEDCGVAKGVQRGASAQQLGIPHAEGVRGGAGSGLLHS